MHRGLLTGLYANPFWYYFEGKRTWLPMHRNGLIHPLLYLFSAASYLSLGDSHGGSSLNRSPDLPVSSHLPQIIWGHVGIPNPAEKCISFLPLLGLPRTSWLVAKLYKQISTNRYIQPVHKRQVHLKLRSVKMFDPLALNSKWWMSHKLRPK